MWVLDPFKLRKTEMALNLFRNGQRIQIVKNEALSQPALTCLKSTIETLKGVKYIQS